MTLIDKAEALLPCPFCGGEAEWKSGGPGCAWVSCKSCPAETSDGNIPRIMEAWNRRALPARGVGADAVLDAAHAYLVQQYGHSPLKHPVDRARILSALTPTDAAHVNETPKSEHDAGNVLTDAALIARLREIQGQAGLFASAAAERIEALRAERDEHAEALKVNNAVLCDALLRIVAAEAVAEKLRAKIAAEARRYANIYDEGTDGRNTFTIFAEWVEARAALTTEADNE